VPVIGEMPFMMRDAIESERVKDIGEVFYKCWSEKQR
jgi:hypothetical protein